MGQDGTGWDRMGQLAKGKKALLQEKSSSLGEKSGGSYRVGDLICFWGEGEAPGAGELTDMGQEISDRLASPHLAGRLELQWA